METTKKTTKKPATKRNRKPRAVLVTTDKRGVFFGYATDTSGDVIRLSRCRMVTYWDASMRGVFGLAANGPSNACKIGPATETELRGITSVSEVCAAAAARFEAAPWA